MLDTEAFITKIRNIIADNTSLVLTQVFTPQLPQTGDNICAVTLLGGTPDYNLCGVNYFDQTFRVIVRGSENDNTTRTLCDEIYNSLDRKQDVSFGTGNKIIMILANTTPTYVGKDENQRNVYNITFRAKVI